MNHLINVLFVLMALVFCPFLHAQKFSQDELLEDIRFLKKSLLKYHPNLFVHSTFVEFENYFSEIESTIPDTVSEEEAFSVLASVSSIIKDGHTVFLPKMEYLDFHFKNSTFFPFRVYWNESGMYILKNFSEDKSIQEGAKILSINGESIKIITDRMMSGLMRDGGNLHYPTWILNQYFSSYYSFFSGYPHQFNLEFDKSNVTVQALSKKQINLNRELRYPDKLTLPISFTIEEKDNLAIIKILDFHKDVLKQHDQKFKKELKIIFSKIEELGITQVAIDLRDNQGGNPKYGRLLLAHVMNNPFQLVAQYSKVRKSKANLPSERLTRSKFNFTPISKPFKNNYKGSLYVFTNGGTFSVSAIISSCLQRNKRAVFIGQETGGSGSVLSSESRKTELPNTKITVEISTLQYLLTKEELQEMGGVKPGYIINQDVESIINKVDLCKKLTMELIRD